MKTKNIAGLLGIDIRANFVRLVELSYCNSKYRLEACAHAVIRDGDTGDEAVIDAIRMLVKQISPKTKAVAVALAHSVVTCKEVEVDSSLSHEETLNFLQFNLNEHFCASNNNICFDYYPVDEETKKDVVTKKYKLVAVLRERIESWRRLLRAVDLCPKIIDVDVYALERAVRWQLKKVVGLVAIINIDYGNILIIVIDHEKIVYVHEEYIGGDNLKTVVQIIEQLDFKLRMVYAVLSQPLNEIVLGGERLLLPGLVTEVSSRLNVQAVSANPFLDIPLDSAVVPELAYEVAPMMMVSCGLALRTAYGYEH